MTMKLYEATDALATVDAWILEHADEILANGGELTPELEALLNEAEGTFDAKVEKVALKVRELIAEADVVKVEADRLTQRAKTAKNAADSLKAYLHRQMDEAGKVQVKGTLVTVALQKNPPRVVTERSAPESEGRFVAMVPALYEWNKDAIKDAHKAGEPLPEGVTVEQGMSLRIR